MFAPSSPHLNKMNGDKKENKNLRSALKSVVAPLLIVIRREIREGNKKLLDFVMARPDVQKTEVTNQQKEIKVANFPDKIKAEITNPQKEVEVKGLANHFVGLTKKVGELKDSIAKRLTTTTDSIVKSIKELKDTTLSVKITNQKDIKFPQVQGVKLSDKDIQAIVKGIKQEVQRVQIENSTPGEAVPVVLTDLTRRRLYDLTVMITGGGGGKGGDVNLAGLKKVLDDLLVCCNKIDVNTDEIEAKLESIKTKLDTLNATDFATETTLAALLTAFSAEDFATQTTLAALLAAFTAEDFATETTLLALKASLDSAIKAEDSVHVSGDKGVMALGVRNDARTALAADGDYIPFITNGNGEVFVKDTDVLAALGGAGATFHDAGEVAVSTQTETTIATFTVPSGKKACLKEISIQGDSTALWRLELDSVFEWGGEVNQQQPSTHASVAIEGAATKVYNLKVTPGSSGSGTRKFRGSISGTVL